MAREVGWGQLAVVPSFEGFQAKLEAGSSKALVAAGQSGGVKFGESAGKAAKGRLSSIARSVVAPLAGAFAAVKVKDFLVDAVKGASDLNESTNKVQQVFGDASSTIFQFSKTADKALGQTNQQARDAASTFGIFGKAAHLTDKQNARFSVRLTKMASDLASFHNTSPEEAIQALGAALRGESEPIRRYGVLLDDASLKATALSMGLLKPVKDKAKIQSAQVTLIERQKAYNEALKEHGKNSEVTLKAQAALGLAQSALQKATDGTLPPLSQQQKILAANKLIMQQTTVAQGDFQRTSGGLANQQRILSARWEDAKVAIGTALLPTVQEAVKFLNDKGVPAFEKFADWFTKKGIPAIKGFIEKAKPVAKSLLPAVKTAADDVKTAFQKMAPFVKDVFDGFMGLPKWAQSAIVLGGGALALGAKAKHSKVGGLLGDLIGSRSGGLGGGSGILGLLGKSKPIPVYVVNEGFGGGPGGKAGWLAASATWAGRAGRVGKAVGPEGPAALASTAMDFVASHDAGLRQNRNVDLIRHLMNPNTSYGFSPKKWAGMNFFQKMNPENGRITEQTFKDVDAQLASIEKRHPEKVIGLMTSAAKQAHEPLTQFMTEMLARFPQLRSEFLAAGDAAQGIGVKVKDASGKFARLDTIIGKIPARKQVTIDVRAHYSAEAKRLMEQQGLTGTGYVPAGVTVIHNGDIKADDPSAYHRDMQRRHRRAASDGIRHRG